MGDRSMTDQGFLPNSALAGKGETPMSKETQQHDITKRRVVYHMPGVDAVTIRQDVRYLTTDADVLTMDIYYPPEAESGARIPAVVIVAGYPDLGFEAKVGCKF